MATPVARGVVFIHSAPKALCPHLEWAVGRSIGRAVNFAWQDQPALSGARRAEFAWDGYAGTGAAIATAIRGWEHLRFEVTEEPTPGTTGGRWMHTPDLGVHFSQMDAGGSVVVPEERIRAALELRDALDVRRELDVALGTAWDDELEIFRTAGDDAPVVWLHKVG
ncbi:DUF3145 family protein [Microbacterium sp. ZXX196]|uniref:DUF3145 family protein n=1 Tax=Microbacterium sp. ZXX196 TaxID=2609291 RepID=UPI0012B6B07A|nr:DUF3145 family protein [Microbacterium sp. ZXX196]MTE23836.1 DUF3145 family protein [Microbacterium sp. ZXX196]